MKGTVSPLAGSDILLIREDGTFQQDVRLLLIAEDESPIIMTYRGVRRASVAVDERLTRGEIVDASEYYLRTTPYFETASPAHAWLNGIVSIAKGGAVLEASSTTYSRFCNAWLRRADAIGQFDIRKMP